MVSGSSLNGVVFRLFLFYVWTSTGIAQKPDIPSFDTSCGNSSTLPNIINYGRYCTNLLTAWYRDNFEPFYYYRDIYSPLRFQNTSQSWADVCRWSWYTANCFEGLLPDCDSGIGEELLNNPRFYLVYNNRRLSEFNADIDSDHALLGFYRKSCTGKSLNADIQSRVDNPDLDVNTTCINQDRQEELGKCLRGLEEEERNKYSYFTSTDVRGRINKVAEATVNCMYSVINRSPCNRATKRILYHVAKLQLPHYIDEKLLNLDESTTSDFSSLLRCTVGVYGDPHLRMCFEPGLTTCSALGPQILIANGWFLIAGTHERIGRGSSLPATSLRSVQIVFLSFDMTRTVATYVGENGNLPSTFEGINATEVGTGNDRITLTLRDKQREFVQHSTGMVLRLRQWSGNYFFTLRVAQGVIKKSYGLLATGCPEDQVIYRSRWTWFSPAVRRKRAVTREMCETACNETIAEDNTFRDTCAFDCYAVDDVTFGINITLPAVEDTVQIVALDEEIRSRAVSPPKTTPSPNGGLTASRNNVHTLFFTVMCLIYSTLNSYSF